MAAVCPIFARAARYPGEVPIAKGHAGQTNDAVNLCHQLRTIDMDRVTAVELGGRNRYITDPEVRKQVRSRSSGTSGWMSHRQRTALRSDRRPLRLAREYA
jgi:hypothetical protein